MRLKRGRLFKFPKRKSDKLGRALRRHHFSVTKTAKEIGKGASQLRKDMEKVRLFWARRPKRIKRDKSIYD